MDEIFNPGGNESTYPYEAFGYLSDNHLRARYNTDTALTQKNAAKTARERYKSHSRNNSLDLDYSKGKAVKAKTKALRKEKPSNLDSNSQSLETQVEDMRRRSTCIICVDCVTDAVFLPCRHLLCCSRCAKRLEACPNCRQHCIGILEVERPEE